MAAAAVVVPLSLGRDLIWKSEFNSYFFFFGRV